MDRMLAATKQMLSSVVSNQVVLTQRPPLSRERKDHYGLEYERRIPVPAVEWPSSVLLSRFLRVIAIFLHPRFSRHSRRPEY